MGLNINFFSQQNRSPNKLLHAKHCMVYLNIGRATIKTFTRFFTISISDSSFSAPQRGRNIQRAFPTQAVVFARMQCFLSNQSDNDLIEDTIINGGLVSCAVYRFDNPQGLASLTQNPKEHLLFMGSGHFDTYQIQGSFGQYIVVDISIRIDDMATGKKKRLIT
jgi:hypothetical protein